MHVHRPAVDLGVADMYAAQAAKKAAEAKQAAEVRRKLLRASAGIDGETTEFASFAIGERSGGSSRQGTGEGQEQGNSFASPSARSAKPDNSAVTPLVNPLSVWA